MAVSRRVHELLTEIPGAVPGIDDLLTIVKVYDQRGEIARIRDDSLDPQGFRSVQTRVNQE